MEEKEFAEVVTLDEENDERAPDPLYEIRLGQRSPMVVVSNAAITTEKVRIAAQVRLTHLAKRGNDCPFTREILRRAEEFEQWADATLAGLVRNHPTSHWTKRVKGTGGEAIGKVLGHIDNFGRFYELGDPMIPSCVKRLPIEVDGKKLVWVEGIERFPTPSKLHAYAGMKPGQRREANKLLSFNDELRTMLWRLGVSLMKSKGKFYDFYHQYRMRLMARFMREHIKVLPTPKTRFCVGCNEEKGVKSARFCPKCGTELALKTEPPGFIWEGHVRQMCMRRMIKLFLDLLWAVWREAKDLPLRQPYAVEFLGHSTIITPWDMVDR